MKKHNLFKVVTIIMFVTVVLSWFLQGTSFQTELSALEIARVGIFDILSYSIGAVSYFGYIPLIILAIGGFYGVLHKTNSYHNLVDKIVKVAKKEKRWIPLTIVIVAFAILSSIVGQPLFLLFFFPFAITILLGAGYDKITAVLSTVGAVMVGYIGSTLSFSNLEVINSVFNVEMNSLLWVKALLLVLSTALLIVFTVLRANKNFNTKVKLSELGFEEKVNKKAKMWPVILTFSLVLVVFVLSYLDWENVFSITVFADMLKSIQDFKIGEFHIFGDLLGEVAAFGQWQILQAPALILLATILVALLSKIKLDDFLDSYLEGLKKAVKPAILALMVHLILMIAVYHQNVLTIVSRFFSTSAKNPVNVFNLSLAGLITNLFTPDVLYSTQVSGIYVASFLEAGKALQIAAINWQAIYGFSMLLVPTSSILLVTLSYLNVSYTKYIKSVWKFLAALVLLIIVFMLITRMIIL